MTLRCPPGRSYRRVRARGGRSRWGGPNYNLLETHGFVVGPQDDFPGAPARELRCPPRCEGSLGDGGSAAPVVLFFSSAMLPLKLMFSWSKLQQARIWAPPRALIWGGTLMPTLNLAYEVGGQLLDNSFIPGWSGT